MYIYLLRPLNLRPTSHNNYPLRFHPEQKFKIQIQAFFIQVYSLLIAYQQLYQENAANLSVIYIHILLHFNAIKLHIMFLMIGFVLFFDKIV